MSTAAATRSTDSSHWYFPNGQPCYEVKRAKGDGMRASTLADARKLGLLPSVTTILRILHKQPLVDWLIEQACLSVLTAPKLATEDLDAFVYRVLHTERQQDAEGQKARDLGTDVHVALEAAVQGQQCDDDLRVYVDPVLEIVKTLGVFKEAERIVVGTGYAGKVDLILTTADGLLVVDFKTGKRLPKESYNEHELQLSAYAAALHRAKPTAIETANIYISTTEPGKCALCLNKSWADSFDTGFAPLVKHWQWANDYTPPAAPEMEGITP